MKSTIAALVIAVATFASTNVYARLVELKFDIHPTWYYDYAGEAGSYPSSPLGSGIEWSIVVDDFRGSFQGFATYQAGDGSGNGGQVDPLPTFLTDRLPPFSIVQPLQAYVRVSPQQQPALQPAMLLVEGYERIRAPKIGLDALVIMSLGRGIPTLMSIGGNLPEFLAAYAVGDMFTMSARVEASRGDLGFVPNGTGYIQFGGFAVLQSATVLPPPAPIPEPGSWATLGVGLTLLALWRGRQRSR